MVVILATDKVLKMLGFTITVAVAEAVPPVPVQVSVYVALPGPVGATAAVAFVVVAIKGPAVALDEALHEVALVDFHVRVTA